MGKQQFAIASLSLIIFVTFANLVAVQCACPAINSKVTGLDFKKFQGLWKEYSKLLTSYDANSKCQAVQFSGDARAFNAVFTKQTNNKGTVIRGNGQLTPNGQLSITFPAPGGISYFWVLDTDYTNFATLYSCSDKGEYASILSRSTNVKATYIQQAMKGLTNNGLNLGLTKVVQDCTGKKQ